MATNVRIYIEWCIAFVIGLFMYGLTEGWFL